jgi:hypothetical protein
MKMEAPHYVEMSVLMYQITRCYITEDEVLFTDHCEGPKSRIYVDDNFVSEFDSSHSVHFI